jgi:hypothetical protein
MEKNNGPRVLPKYTREALKDYVQFSKSLVTDASRQFYKREPLYREIELIKSEMDDVRAKLRTLRDDQQLLIRQLEALRRDKAATRSGHSDREMMAQIHANNVALNDFVARLKNLMDSHSVKRKLLEEGTPDDKAMVGTIQKLAVEFEAGLVQKYGGVDITGLKPVQIVKSVLKATAPCDAAEGLRRQGELTKALCAGIPVAIGTYQMRRFLVRDLYFSKDWKPYAPTGAAGDALGGAGHAMTLVGFDDIEGEPHFIFRNSWGKGTEAALPVAESCAISEAVIFVDSGSSVKSSEQGVSEHEAWAKASVSHLRTQASRLARTGWVTAVAR